MSTKADTPISVLPPSLPSSLTLVLITGCTAAERSPFSRSGLEADGSLRLGTRRDQTRKVSVDELQSIVCLVWCPEERVDSSAEEEGSGAGSS